jgi:hypothetical protein
VTRLPWVHRRLEFPRPGQAVPDYANLYRLGDDATAGPLVLYVGGAITEAQHAERFASEPTPVLEPFEAAHATSPLPRIDLIIAPSPPRRTDPATVLDEFEDHFLDELLPALGGAEPTTMAFVGYSFGAHLATGLALGQERARALVILGGAGIAEAARAAGPLVARQLMVTFFHDTGDPLPPPARSVGSFPAPLKPWVMPPRPGGHAFADYAGNGSVEEAFGLALSLLE